MSDTPLADPLAEAERLLDAGEGAGVRVRLLGGLAIRLHSDHVPATLERTYGDIDLATTKGDSRKLRDLLGGNGYEPAREFNALNGNRRLLFHDVPSHRKLDVFVDRFEMCHAIPIVSRIELEPRTIPLAELLLTKLQVVELNDKDLRDIVTLFYGHEVGEQDGETINAAAVAKLTGDDWGLWRTVQLNFERLRERLGSLGLEAGDQRSVIERADALWERIESEPKSRSWRMRARIGDRKRWYETPEDV